MENGSIMEVVKQPPVRCKLMRGVKGEFNISVAIDGDDEDDVIQRLLVAYERLHKATTAMSVVE